MSDNDDAQSRLWSILDQKSTEELVHIWQENNRSLWGSNSFATIKSILTNRNVKIPQQTPVPRSREEVVAKTVEKTHSYQKIGAWSGGIVGAIGGTAYALSPFNFSAGKFLDWRINLVLLMFPLIGMAIGRAIARRQQA